MSEETFVKRWQGLAEARGPLCVGIDPHPQLLQAWGLRDDVESLRRFCRGMVSALATRVAAVKPQSAFFERFGSAGVAVLEETIAQCRNAGALVIVDAKRGDIGSTMHAYAHAYLHPDSPLCADAVTLSPYLGVGASEPAYELAHEYGRGLFLLALTSNPQGLTIQRARLEDGRTVAQSVIDEAAARNIGAAPCGNLGVVVGATVPDCRDVTDSGDATAHDLSALNGPVLVPGMGTQGGQPHDLPRVLGTALPWAIPIYAREIARQGPNEDEMRAAVADAAAACRKIINTHDRRAET
ncbi:MAG TPA: orotidine-5'-phosphate decarboxylase [Candidatus Stackebrandtia faecavium]|nr:orotidine-5'-phosphate decarboxylase [Candidatus Stackebrandtia faecavium]